MTTCLVRLNGQNFFINGDEGPRKKRFRATRLLEAENQNLLKALARELISNDPRLRKIILNEESDPPVLYLESVREIPVVAYAAQNRVSSFY
jgi:hypothetical protein